MMIYQRCVPLCRVAPSAISPQLFLYKHSHFIRLKSNGINGNWSKGRIRGQIDEVELPFTSHVVGNQPLVLSRLLKPTIFAITFSSVSFVGATIWQYENLRSRAKLLVTVPRNWINKKIGWRESINEWWRTLPEGQKVFTFILFANLLVFFAWQLRPLKGTMAQYFCSNPSSKTICWPLILSTFSHYSIMHIFANMYVLNSFSTGIVSSMGKEQFVAFYLTAGVLSSLVSSYYKVLLKKPSFSLGASGAVMAMIGYICTKYPDTLLSIMFIPFFTFKAGLAIKTIMAVDAAGLIFGWKLFDHAAHLGGALFGVAWYYWGNEHIWQKRAPIVQRWHDFRNSK